MDERSERMRIIEIKIMELDIYELYVLHLVKVRLISAWPANESEECVIACELLFKLEEMIIKEIINKLDDKSLFTNWLLST